MISSDTVPVYRSQLEGVRAAQVVGLFLITYGPGRCEAIHSFSEPYRCQLVAGHRRKNHYWFTVFQILSDPPRAGLMRFER